MTRASLLLAMAATPITAQTSDSLNALLDRMVPAAIAAAHVPGAVVAVVRGDEVLALRGFGFANLEDRVAADPNRSAYRLASVAKLFVATTVLQRLSQGHLTLDRPVSAWLQGTPHVDPRITLRHLLTHTSGLDDRVVGYAAHSRDAMRPLRQYLAERLPDQHWPPGTLVSYSNHGMALAALVAEVQAQTSYAALAQREVFAPLGMAHTWYITPPTEALVRDVVVGYRCGASGCERVPPAWTHAYPVGLAFSTAADMSHFMRGFVGDSSPLSAVTRAEALRRQFTHDPRVPGMGAGFMEQEWQGHTVFTHAGGVPGTSTALVIAPNDRLGVFIATNAGEPGFVREVLHAVLKATLPDHTPAPPTADGGVDEYTGSWQLGRFSHRTIERFPATFAFTMRTWARGDTLLFLAGNTTRRFVRVDSLLLQDVSDGSRMALARDANGRVHRLFAGIPTAGVELPGGLERVPWYQAPYFLNEYVSWLLLGPMIVLALWGAVAFGGWVRRRRGGARVPRTDPTAVLAMAAVVVALAIFLVFGFGFIAASTRDLARGSGITFGPGWKDLALLRLAWPLALAAIPITAFTAMAWRRHWWSTFGRACYSLLAVGALATSHFLVWWGYVPGRW